MVFLLEVVAMILVVYTENMFDDFPKDVCQENSPRGLFGPPSVPRLSHRRMRSLNRLRLSVHLYKTLIVILLTGQAR